MVLALFTFVAMMQWLQLEWCTLNGDEPRSAYSDLVTLATCRSRVQLPYTLPRTRWQTATRRRKIPIGCGIGAAFDELEVDALLARVVHQLLITDRNFPSVPLSLSSSGLELQIRSFSRSDCLPAPTAQIVAESVDVGCELKFVLGRRPACATLTVLAYYHIRGRIFASRRAAACSKLRLSLYLLDAEGMGEIEVDGILRRAASSHSASSREYVLKGSLNPFILGIGSVLDAATSLVRTGTQGVETW